MCTSTGHKPLEFLSIVHSTSAASGLPALCLWIDAMWTPLQNPQGSLPSLHETTTHVTNKGILCYASILHQKFKSGSSSPQKLCNLPRQHYKLHRTFFAPLVIHIAKPPVQDASIQHNINMTRPSLRSRTTSECRHKGALAFNIDVINEQGWRNSMQNKKKEKITPSLISRLHQLIASIYKQLRKYAQWSTDLSTRHTLSSFQASTWLRELLSLLIFPIVSVTAHVGRASAGTSR